MASSSNRPTRSTGSGSARTPVAQRAPGASRRTGAAGATSSKRGFFDYPRSGKGPIRRWVPSWRVVVGTGLTFVALVAGLVIAAYASIDIPNGPDEFALAETSKVYYSDGVTEMATYAEQDREIVTTDQIPEHVKQAVVAAEDRSFYENSGIDPQGMARALIGNLKGGRTTGGSTITQQYVERYYTGQTTSDYVGKFKEVLMAVKIDRQEDKDEILTNYLNTIYFGRGANGIQVAALKYFGVPASDLTVEQAALIAGVIPNPTGWDPRNDPEKALERWNYVLGGMVTQGYITQAERDAMVYPEAIPFEQKNKLAGPRGYLLDMVTRELESDAAIDEEALLTQGLTIVTTIDKGIQDMAEAAIAEMPADHSPNLVKTIVTIDPATGGYLALYGGADFTAVQLNGATQGSTQAGSTFKPFTLMAGLEAGKTLTDTFDGNSPKMFGDYKASNFDLDDFGQISLEKATANSVNTAYVQLNEEIGPDKTVDAAVRAGIPADSKGLEANLANVLGTASVTPVALTSAYATFAAQGVYHDPHILASVVRDGEVTYTPPNTPEQRFEAANVAELTYALTKVVEDGSGKKAAALDVPIAGKTGTSQENKSAWFVGYTPQFVTAVTLYQTGLDGSEEQISAFGGKSEITGGSIPVEVWTNYMGKVLDGRDVVEFPERTKKKTKPTPTATPSATPEPTPEPTTEPPVVAPVTVPGGLVGRSQGEADGSIRAAGLNASVTEVFDSNVAKGVVVSVVPGAGSSTPAGSTVTIVVSKGPDPASVPTPTPTPTPTEPPAPTVPVPPANGQANGNTQPGNS